MPNPTAAHWMQQPRCVGGHFAGIQFFDDNIDTPRMAVEVEYLEAAFNAGEGCPRRCAPMEARTNVVLLIYQSRVCLHLNPVFYAPDKQHWLRLSDGNRDRDRLGLPRQQHCGEAGDGTIFSV